MIKIFLIIFLHILIVQCKPCTSNHETIIVSEAVFHKLGKYRGFTSKGSEYQKSYFFTRNLKSSWADARSFCNSYGLEFISLDTLEEARTVLSFADNNSNLRTLTSVWLYIDGVSLTINSPTDWYWTKSGKTVSYSIPWRPGSPNNSAGSEYCLTIGKGSINEQFGFDDAKCDSSTLIACQSIDFFIP